MNNIAADQSARMCRLVSPFFVRKPLKTGFFATRPIYASSKNDLTHLFNYISIVSDFELNVPPTAKVIWRQVSFNRPEELGIKLGTPGYKVSGLSTTPWRLLQELVCKQHKLQKHFFLHNFLSKDEPAKEISVLIALSSNKDSIKLA